MYFTQKQKAGTKIHSQHRDWQALNKSWLALLNSRCMHVCPDEYVCTVLFFYFRTVMRLRTFCLINMKKCLSGYVHTHETPPVSCSPILERA